MAHDTLDTFDPPAPYALADWRRRINDLYAAIRATRDPRAGWQLWHETRSALFARHPASPIPATRRAGFAGIVVQPYDPALRFAVALEPAAGETIAFDLGGDGIMHARPMARTRGLEGALGAELTAWWITGYGGGMFLPFRDASCGAESYGGGRYLADAIKGAELGLGEAGRLIVDFNFAYNPSCALSDDFICPLSPPENTLPARIIAGEAAP